MAEVGNMPAKMKVTEFDGSLFDYSARGYLFGFGGQDRRRHRFGAGFLERGANLLFDLRGPDIPHNDEEAIVWGVFFPVIAVDILAFYFVEDVRIADDRESVRAPCISGLEEAARGALARIVLIHVHLAEDDLLFLFQFL